MMLLAFALALSAAPVFAEQVVLNDGRVLEGELFRASSDTIKIGTVDGLMEISRGDIRSVAVALPGFEKEISLAAHETAAETAAAPATEPIAASPSQPPDIAGAETQAVPGAEPPTPPEQAETPPGAECAAVPAVVAPEQTGN